ncbi:MAG: hypothetical protein P8R42_12995 [Candidatus Binatia bacterium]|nr:hypothetical protein [Candidatus Binatia bacterium]
MKPLAETLLPPQFAALEPYAGTWCLATEPERWRQRQRSSMEEMQKFYDAFLPRVEQAIAHCDAFPLEEMPADADRLLRLVYSLLLVSFAVEVWRQPDVLHCGPARIDRVVDPAD